MKIQKAWAGTNRLSSKDQDASMIIPKWMAPKTNSATEQAIWTSVPSIYVLTPWYIVSSRTLRFSWRCNQLQIARTATQWYVLAQNFIPTVKSGLIMLVCSWYSLKQSAKTKHNIPLVRKQDLQLPISYDLSAQFVYRMITLLYGNMKAFRMTKKTT